MGRYRKIDTRVWNDEKFCALSDRAKLVFFMLMTHPSMTSMGAMRGTTAGLAEELHWGTEAFMEAFQEVLSKGMAEYDPKACFIALPNFLKYNSPESPNVVKSWTAALDLLPECSLKTGVIARSKALLEGFGGAWAKASGRLREGFGKAMPNQEQEQEQDKSTPSLTFRGPGGESPKSPLVQGATGKRSVGHPSTLSPEETEYLDLALGCWPQFQPGTKDKPVPLSRPRATLCARWTNWTRTRHVPPAVLFLACWHYQSSCTESRQYLKALMNFLSPSAGLVDEELPWAREEWARQNPECPAPSPQASKIPSEGGGVAEEGGGDASDDSRAIQSDLFGDRS